MFNWLVARISASMKPKIALTKCSYIGCLDIFGFEIFETNSFEQLCINFCNEKLQANFNVNVFQKEQELYAKEGIKAKRLEWVSNQHVIDCIEKKPKGIFPLLDNQWKMGQRGSDKTFLSKCEKELVDKKAFVGYVVDVWKKKNDKSLYSMVELFFIFSFYFFLFLFLFFIIFFIIFLQNFTNPFYCLLTISARFFFFQVWTQKSTFKKR